MVLPMVKSVLIQLSAPHRQLPIVTRGEFVPPPP